MTTAVFPHPFFRVNDENSGFGPGGARNHVLKEFNMARGVDEDVVPFGGLEKGTGRIDGDALVLLIR